MKLYRVVPPAVLYLVFFAASVTAQPDINIIGGDTVDWGRTAPGRLAREVRIVNLGITTLVIDRVEPSCGCTTAPLDKSELEPGDTATLSVSVNMPGTSGRQTKHIGIYSNDPRHPLVGLTLTAEFVRIVTVSPTQFPLPIGPIVDSTVTTEVELTNNGHESIALESPVVFEEAGLAITLDSLTKRSLNPGESVTLHARITAKVEGGVYGKIMVGTSSRSMPNVVIPVQAIARKRGGTVAPSGTTSTIPEDAGVPVRSKKSK